MIFAGPDNRRIERFALREFESCPKPGRRTEAMSWLSSGISVGFVLVAAVGLATTVLAARR